MTEKRETEERALGPAEIDRLAAAGAIREESLAALRAAQRAGVEWQGWATLRATALGVLFLLAGTVFFFAWNWKGMSPLLRFGVLEAGVVLATGGAVLAGRRTGLRQGLLTAATVLTGVLVAVYGQVYQTGADAFEVFALWAVLALGWVVVAQFAPLWLLWLAVLQTAMATFGGQVLVPSETVSWPVVFAGIGLVGAAAVALRERLVYRGNGAWLADEWVRIALVAGALGWLNAGPWYLIVDFGWNGSEPIRFLSLVVLLWAGLVGGGVYFFTDLRGSLPCVALCHLSIAGIVVLGLGRIVVEMGDYDAGSWLLIGIVAIIIFASAAALLARCARHISASNLEPQHKTALPS